MEGLIELVAASFVRHGIELPVADASISTAVPPNPTQAALPIEPTALPEHTYRKKPEAGLAT